MASLPLLFSALGLISREQSVLPTNHSSPPLPAPPFRSNLIVTYRVPTGASGDSYVVLDISAAFTEFAAPTEGTSSMGTIGDVTKFNEYLFGLQLQEKVNYPSERPKFEFTEGAEVYKCESVLNRHCYTPLSHTTHTLSLFSTNPLGLSCSLL